VEIDDGNWPQTRLRVAFRALPRGERLRRTLCVLRLPETVAIDWFGLFCTYGPSGVDKQALPAL
jgi:hypothetical protein